MVQHATMNAMLVTKRQFRWRLDQRWIANDALAFRHAVAVAPSWSRRRLGGRDRTERRQFPVVMVPIPSDAAKQRQHDKRRNPASDGAQPAFRWIGIWRVWGDDCRCTLRGSTFYRCGRTGLFKNRRHGSTLTGIQFPGVEWPTTQSAQQATRTSTIRSSTALRNRLLDQQCAESGQSLARRQRPLTSFELQRGSIQRHQSFRWRQNDKIKRSRTDRK